MLVHFMSPEITTPPSYRQSTLRSSLSLSDLFGLLFSSGASPRHPRLKETSLTIWTIAKGWNDKMLRRNTERGCCGCWLTKLPLSSNKEDAQGLSSSPGEPCSPQSRSLSLRRRAAALSPSCQAPRATGLCRSNHPLPPSGCRMRWQAEEPSSRRSRSVVAFEAASLAAQQGLCSKAIMRTLVVEAVVPWLSRARLCDVR